MNLDTTQPKSRRALLAAAVGGVAAAAAVSVARVIPVSASDGEAVTVGGSFTGTKTTAFDNTENTNPTFTAKSTKGNAIHGKSTDQDGVKGESEKGPGVLAVSTSGDGVSTSTNSGNGITASSDAGNGVETSSMNGYALATTEGGVHFKGLTGVATIKSGDETVKVTPEVAVGNQSLVLLSPEANIGSRALWYTKGSGEITIHLSSSRSNDTKVAWAVFDHG